MQNPGPEKVYVNADQMIVRRCDPGFFYKDAARKKGTKIFSPSHSAKKR